MKLELVNHTHKQLALNSHPHLTGLSQFQYTVDLNPIVYTLILFFLLGPSQVSQIFRKVFQQFHKISTHYTL